MNETEDIIRAIAYALKEAYGDATVTALDVRAAEAVFKRITEMGMAPLSTVAAIVAAAGGRVAVSEDILMDPPTEVMRAEDPVTRTVVLKVRMPARSA